MARGKIHEVIIPVTDREHRVLRKVPCRLTAGTWGDDWVSNVLLYDPPREGGLATPRVVKSLVLEPEAFGDLCADLRDRQPRPKGNLEADLYDRALRLARDFGLPTA